MPLSAAEKQRRYRARRDADPVKRAEYLEKERQAWHNKKAKGKIKMIGDLSSRSQRKLRRQWREAQKRHRKKSSLPIIPDATPSLPSQPAVSR